MDDALTCSATPERCFLWVDLPLPALMEAFVEAGLPKAGGGADFLFDAWSLLVLERLPVWTGI